MISEIPFLTAAVTASVIAFQFSASPAWSQRAYEPIQQWPGIEITDSSVSIIPKRELLAVMVSSSWCIANTVEGFDLAIRDMKDALSVRADSLGYSFSAVGVALDWDLEDGIRYLMEGHSSAGQLSFGPWGEIVVGRDWINTANSLYTLPLGLRWLEVPQVLVFERLVIPHSTYPETTMPRFLFRANGSGEIIGWAKGGFQIRHFPHDPDARPAPGGIE